MLLSLWVSESVCLFVAELTSFADLILKFYLFFIFIFIFFAVVGWSVAVERPCVELDAAILSQIRKLTKCAKHLFYQKKEGVWCRAKRKLYNHKSTYTGLLEHGQKLLCSSAVCGSTVASCSSHELSSYWDVWLCWSLTINWWGF